MTTCTACDMTNICGCWLTTWAEACRDSWLRCPRCMTNPARQEERDNTLSCACGRLSILRWSYFLFALSATPRWDPIVAFVREGRAESRRMVGAASVVVPKAEHELLVAELIENAVAESVLST